MPLDNHVWEGLNLRWFIGNSFLNLGRLIDKEKKVEKILASLPLYFHDKTIALETYFKSSELTVNDLIGDI